MITRVDEKQNQLQNSILGMEATLQRILLAQGTTTVNSSSMGVADLKEHLNALKERIANVTSVIKNPLLRSVLQQELEALLPRIAYEAMRPSNLAHIVEEDTRFRASELRSIPARQKNRVKLICSSYTQTLFGTLHFTTTTSTKSATEIREDHSSNECYKIHTTVVLHPSQWLQSCGLTYGLHINVSMSSWGLDCSLRLHRAVPNTAPIFAYCRDGNIGAIQHLFSQGLASPWDTNSRGFTPLFVSRSCFTWCLTPVFSRISQTDRTR